MNFIKEIYVFPLLFPSNCEWPILPLFGKECHKLILYYLILYYILLIMTVCQVFLT
jgi:hypothetical protein